MAPVQSMGDSITDALQCEETAIQQFYRNKAVFLTGGTGFFGKIIVEKLLRVTSVDHIYLLIRNKKGKDVHTRIEELFDDPVFERLKKNNPKFRHKLTVVSGDCSLPGLGISMEERQQLVENVNIVIHGAATVRFDEKLKIALAINVNGTQEIIKLSKEVVNLKAVVHVSTAFANCIYSHIEEKFYKPRISGENACRLNECLDEITLNNITPTIIGDYPNTYTFTKVLAEDVVHNSGKELPVVIFRPGIVITTYKDPIPGWIDNMYGPCGIVVGAAAGVLRVFYGNVTNVAHVVPVDMSVNALLASAWDVARNKYNETPIYNYIPDPDNPVTWKEYAECGFRYGCKIPLRKSLWFPTFTITSSKMLFHILSFLYHTLPAFLVDAVLAVVGKKPRMRQIYKKIHKFCHVMTYFSGNSWSFSNNNTRNLWSKLSKEDRELFFFDMRVINWTELFEASLYGLRSYVVKDDPSSIPQARTRYNRLKILHYVTLGVIYSLGTFLIYWVLSLVLNGTQILQSSKE